MHRLLTGLTGAVLALGLAVPAWAQTQPLSPDDKAFVAAGLPVLTNRVLDKDPGIVSIPVQFGITGVLKTRLSAGPKSTIPPMEPGQAMFGWPMGSFGVKPEIVWCATRPSNDPEQAWQTVCLPYDPLKKLWFWVPSYWLTPLSLQWRASNPAFTQVEIERGPASLGQPLTLTYALREFDRRDVDIDQFLSIGGYERAVRQIHLPREKDGSVLMPIGGGVLRLSQVGKDRHAVTAEWVKPPTEGARDLPL